MNWEDYMKQDYRKKGSNNLMKNISIKYENLMNFWLNHKMKRLTKKATDKELIELYYEWYPYYSGTYNSNLDKKAIFKKIVMGYTAMYVILNEFHKRYPNQFLLNEQYWYNNKTINDWIQSKYRMIKETENHGNKK